MYISPKFVYIRHLGKLYIYLIGTESVPAIFHTFRQVIHIDKYTFRQVSLYKVHGDNFKGLVRDWDWLKNSIRSMSRMLDLFTNDAGVNKFLDVLRHSWPVECLSYSLVSLLISCMGSPSDVVVDFLKDIRYY